MPVHLWNRWWYGEIMPGPLGLTRIAFGVIVLAYALLLWPERFLWFSNRGLLTVAQSDQLNNFQNPVLRINLLDYLTGDRALTGFFLVFFVAAFLLTIGFWTRLSAFVVWMGLLSLHNRDNAIHNSGDTVMIVMAIYLFLAPAGAACSLDRLKNLLRGKEGDSPRPIVPWAQRLMQLQVATVYLCTSFSKLTGDRWLNGTAAYYPLHLPDSRRFPVPWTDAHHLWIIHLLTYGTLTVESAMWSLIWFPRLRLAVLGLGILLHLGIDYSLNIPLFSFLMIASYGVFLTQADLERFVARLQEPLASLRLRLLYDGECDFCKSCLLIVRFLDPFHLITFLDAHTPDELRQANGVSAEDADTAAWAVDARNRRSRGFFCFRTVTWRLPVLCWLAPLLYIPGVPWLGVRAYAWVANNRSWLPVAARYKTPPRKVNASVGE